ncbi:MAG TPA: zf-HC2 domain-containing protein [Cellulomonas sp.]
MTPDDVVREHEAFADWDAAYVLGALSPDDRHAYEDHLAGCERCRAAVAELAPLPGLLARASRPDEGDGTGPATGPAYREDQPAGSGERGADDEAGEIAGLEGPGGPGAATPRADLVDLVVRRERRHRLRRRLLVGGIAAALVVGVAVGVPLANRAPAGSAAPAETVALEQQVATSLTATVGLTPVAWGTRLSMECDYPAGGPTYTRPPGTPAGPPVYALVVTDVDGVESQVSTWSAEPGHDVRLDAATAVPLDRIASLEVRSSSGKTLLSADLATR